MQPVNIEHSDANDEDWSRVSSPPSFIKELPEFVKLILASLFVALVVHAFFASRRNAINEAQRGPSVHGRVGAIGSSGGGSGSVNCDDISSSSEDDGISDKNDRNDVSNNDNDSGGRALGGASASAASVREEAATATTNKNSAKARAKAAKKSSQNAVAERNYDALICKKPSESDDDGNEEDGGEISLTNQNKKHEQPSTSILMSTDNKQTLKSNTNTNDTEKAPADTTSQLDDEATPQTPPPIELKSKANHPGLQGYYNWHATITSLYRIYAIPTYEAGNNDHDHNDGSNRNYHQAILPMHPSSERGQVPLYIEVTNRTSHPRIDVYWIDYKGNEIHKGSIPNRGGVWSQTTFVGHPWTFRVGEGEENVLVKYAPFRIIPTIAGAETSRVESSGNVEGMQKFVIRDVKEGHVMRWNDGLAPVCWVEDEILPEPPLVPSNRPASNTSTTLQINNAIQWSCQQIKREDAIYQGNGINSTKRLLQYLKNICLHPDDPKYRRLRLGNRIFQETIYNTGARGVLLALGFEELYGCMECGPGGGKMLPHERIQQISDAMMVVNKTLKVMEGGNDGEEGSGALAQPEGGDGFGRAGFGHAGGMNL